MTRNQRRALRCAMRLQRRKISAQDLTDDDWALLLLAAGAAGQRIDALLVADAVIRHARQRTGYFMPVMETIPVLPATDRWPRNRPRPFFVIPIPPPPPPHSDRSA